MVRKMKKVWWWDITAQNQEKIYKPYKKYLTKSYTIGEVFEDKDVVIVKYGGDEDDDACFDAIPRGCVITIDNI